MAPVVVRTTDHGHHAHHAHQRRRADSATSSNGAISPSSGTPSSGSTSSSSGLVERRHFAEQRHSVAWWNLVGRRHLAQRRHFVERPWVFARRPHPAITFRRHPEMTAATAVVGGAETAGTGPIEPTVIEDIRRSGNGYDAQLDKGNRRRQPTGPHTMARRRHITRRSAEDSAGLTAGDVRARPSHAVHLSRLVTDDIPDPAPMDPAGGRPAATGTAPARKAGVGVPGHHGDRAHRGTAYRPRTTQVGDLRKHRRTRAPLHPGVGRTPAGQR